MSDQTHNESMAGVRPGETTATLPDHFDASVYFIGSIHTPFRSRADCPRSGVLSDALCHIEVFEPFAPALTGLEGFSHVILLYWMHQASRRVLVQCPYHSGELRGTFALRSPARPNPIALSVCPLIGIDGARLTVRGLDCVDGTPLIDIKPDRCAYTPLAPAKDGVFSSFGG